MVKRNRQERRRRAGRTRYPFRDSSGELIRGDRRTQPDRRLSGITVEWLEMAHESGRDPAPALTLWNPQEG